MSQDFAGILFYIGKLADIGSAEAANFHPNKKIPRTDLRYGDILDLHLFQTVADSGFHILIVKCLIIA
jgi:hypothetical protein